MGAHRFVSPVAVEPRGGFRIWIRYEDGKEGILDVSHLADKGAFREAWADREYFESVHINEDGMCVSWGTSPCGRYEFDLAPEPAYDNLIVETADAQAQ